MEENVNKTLRKIALEQFFWELFTSPAIFTTDLSGIYTNSCKASQYQ